MKNLKQIVAIGCFLCMCLMISAGAANAAPSDVEKQLRIMREQMEMMQKKMQELEKELQTAQQSAQQSAEQAQQASKEVQQQLSDVAGRFKTLDDLAAKFGHIKLGGYVRSRWWKSDHSENSFDVTEIALQLRYDVSENISGEFHLWFHPSGNQFTSSEYNNWAGPTTFMESGFAEFRNLNIGPVNGKLIAGKTRNLAFGIVPAGSYGGRVTSDYSLFHQSVNISRITGIQYLTSYKNFRWNFALFNGWGYSNNNRYGARNAEIVQLGVSQENTDDNSNKAYSTRLAYVFDRSELFDKLEIGTSYYRSDLSARDRNNINQITGGVSDGSQKDEKFGFDLAFDKGPYMLKAEWMQGDTSGIEADYWYVMPGFLLSKVSSIPVDFFLRYSVADFDEDAVGPLGTRYDQNNDGTLDRWASGAWDKSQVTALAKWHLHPRAKLYFEYYWNKIDEPNGVRTRSNDYGFVELILMY